MIEAAEVGHRSSPCGIILSTDRKKAAEYGEQPETESKNFAKIVLPEVLLPLLTRQDEDAEEDEWRVSMAAGACLSLSAQTVVNYIVPAVILHRSSY